MIADRRAVIFEQVIQIQAEPIAGGCDARIDDIQSELIEGGGGARKAVPARAREDQRRSRAAHARGVERHQRLIRAWFALGQQARMPGDLLG